MNPAVMSSEQFGTVTEIKRKCFDMKLATEKESHPSKAKRSVMGGSCVTAADILEENIIVYSKCELQHKMMLY